ncbi:hypothetical protein [Gottfriedia acidiceleris]|uniref:hypothetical protein n=1 Tax=Gottfriedia acidiceleris TaxID=371036 RepID=UPI00101D2922|nr:hypothetical protein [Gottfriedia acidiceleris]
MKKHLPLISLAITIITAFIPTAAKELPYYHWFGKPYRVYGITETGQWNFQVGDFIVNYLLFYLALYLLFKIINKVREIPKKKKTV